MSGELTMADYFCGAGGSSSGAEAVAGVRVRMASNHWDVALATHQHNLPHADHDMEEIERIEPRRHPSTDLAWFSPSCTFWSVARGEQQDFTEAATEPSLFDLLDKVDEDDEPLPDGAKERSRALMHDVPRFAEYHRYKAIIVENVPEILKWWYFRKWIARMRALGYRHQVLTLNSAFAHQLGAPAPQLRNRVYVVFWQERYPQPDFERWTRPQAWCPSCEQVVTAIRAPKNPARPHGAYGAQYVFRCPKVSCRHAIAHPYTLPAAAVIDWATPGTPIGSRKPRLAPKTIARIEAGLRRYADPSGHGAVSRDPFLTIHRGGPEEIRTRDIAHPMPAFCSSGNHHGLLIPTEGRDGKQAMTAARPLRAQTARNELGLLVPSGGSWNEDAHPVDVPMRARTTKEWEGLFLVPLRGTNRPKAVVEPLDTVAAGGTHHGLAMLVRHNTARGDAGQMCTPVSEPGRTITTAGHQSLVQWAPDLMFAYDTGTTRPVRHPLATQTTVEGDALLQSHIDVDSCLFRMLHAEEIKLGMAFAPGFVLLGTSSRVKVRMCGNAVTPPVARDLVACVVEALTGHAEPHPQPAGGGGGGR